MQSPEDSLPHLNLQLAQLDRTICPGLDRAMHAQLGSKQMGYRGDDPGSTRLGEVAKMMTYHGQGLYAFQPVFSRNEVLVKAEGIFVVGV